MTLIEVKIIDMSINEKLVYTKLSKVHYLECRHVVLTFLPSRLEQLYLISAYTVDTTDSRKETLFFFFFNLFIFYSLRVSVGKELVSL